MSEPVRLFQVEEDDTAQSAPPKSQGTDRATQALLLALRALSQRAIIALEACFSLVTVSLVFWAAYPILTATPTVNQLVGLGVFSIFILASNYLVLKRRG